MRVLPLPHFDISDWSSITAAFAAADSCELRQAWRDEAEPNFQPARVRVGTRENALWIFAQLHDVDIFNDATHLNDATYALGDLFEILLRPMGQEDYFEFYVTPENQQLQLRWPDAEAVWKFDEQHESLKPYLISEAILFSQTEVQSSNNLWRVLASIPASIARKGSTPFGGDWAFSFSRYDCTRGQSEPVLSSSSSHVAPRFHRQQEWGQLTF